MIEKIDAMINFATNTEKTEMLIAAIDKIKAYNRLHQEKIFGENLKMGYIVQESQLNEFVKIEKSCSEHAIISLCTNFEVYYKELVQELLYKFPEIFMNENKGYKEKITEMLSGSKQFNYESIGNMLSLKNRFDYVAFFKKYSIPFLTDDELKIVEHMYVIRNNCVHNAGRSDSQTERRLEKYPVPNVEFYISTKTKMLRTRFNRLIEKSHARTIKECEKLSKKKYQ